MSTEAPIPATPTIPDAPIESVISSIDAPTEPSSPTDTSAEPSSPTADALTDLSTSAIPDALTDPVTPADPFSVYNTLTKYQISFKNPSSLTHVSSSWTHINSRLAPLIYLIVEKKGYDAIAEYVSANPSHLLLDGPVSPLEAICIAAATDEDEKITELLLQLTRPSIYNIAKCLTTAICNGKIDTIRALLAHEHASEAIRIRGPAHLRTAVSVSQTQILDMLLEYRATISSDTGCLSSPNDPLSNLLATVLSDNRAPSVAILAKNGVNLNMMLGLDICNSDSPWKRGHTCLSVWKKIQLAKKQDADCSKFSVTPLMYDMLRGPIEAFIALLDNGADPNYPYPGAALEFAIFAGGQWTITYLLKKGSRFDALHPAAKRQAIEVELEAKRRAIKMGFEPSQPEISENLTQHRVHCSLACAITFGSVCEVKAAIEAINKDEIIDSQFLVLAIERNDKPIIDILLQNQVSINTDYCVTPLVQAIVMGLGALAEHLITLGADINQLSLFEKDNKWIYISPLAAAIIHPQEYIINLLLSKGASISTGDIGPFEALCELVNIPDHVFSFTSSRLLDPQSASVEQAHD